MGLLSISLCIVVGFVSLQSLLAVKQIYTITTTDTVLDSLLTLYPTQIEVFEKEKLLEGGLVKATVYAERKLINQEKSSAFESANAFVVEEDPVNTQQEITRERAEMNACRRSTFDLDSTNKPLVENVFFDCYRPAADIFSFLDQLVAANSKILRKFSISRTVQFKTIPGFKLSTGGSGKKIIYLQALLHAREWITPPTLIYTLTSLIDGLKNQQQNVVSLLDKFDFVFVPVVNLDGYAYTWTNNRYWRKNRRNGYGVDLNRNYGPTNGFGPPGCSTNKYRDTYCGPYAFSEPEIKGIDSWMKNQNGRIAGAIDLHAYGGMVLRGWGYRRGSLPAPHEQKMKAIGEKMKNAIYKVNRYLYRNIRASEIGYTSSGSTVDNWFRTFGNIPSLAFEARGRSFGPPTSDIILSGKEIFQGILVFAQEVAKY